MRLRLKRLVERAVVLSGLAALARMRHRRDVLILAYHNVLRRGEPVRGDASLHLPFDDFRGQLDAIARRHDVVPLASVVTDARESRRPRVAITFDDAYEGAVSVAIPELVRRGLPATIFVAPALLGHRTWWDLLADPASGAVSDPLRQRALSDYHGDLGAVLRHLPAFQIAKPDTLPRIATQAELAAAAAVPGITLASHSWSHRNLAALSAKDLEEELKRPLDWLRANFTAVAPLLSYPYGLFSPAVATAAASAGYAAAFRVEGGWLTRTHRGAHALPRLNVPSGISGDGFEMRLSGLRAR